MLHKFHPSGKVGKWQFHILISATYSYFGANIFHIFHPWAKGKMAHLNFHLYLFGSKQANSHPT